MCGYGGCGWGDDEGFGVGVWEGGEGGLGDDGGVYGGGGEAVEGEFEGEVVGGKVEERKWRREVGSRVIDDRSYRSGRISDWTLLTCI